ncbi:MAG: hypothetical protein ACK58T_09290 [Phycisphaerae bacterium]|jgi:hypothetical protein
MKMQALSMAAALALVSAGASALHLGDLAVGLNNGRLATGVFLINGDNAIPLLSERVFICTLGKFPGFNDDPGMDSLENTFAASQAIGYSMRGSLRKWTGSGLTTAIDERLQTRFGTAATIRVSSTDDTPVVGTTRTASSVGVWHHHIGYTLLTPATGGVYVLEFELWAPGGSLATSKPYWFVFNQNSDDATVQSVVAYLKQNVVQETCAADINADGLVDDSDFTLFAYGYNELLCKPPGCPYDFNGDGAVDDSDFVVFAQQYNELLCP